MATFPGAGSNALGAKVELLLGGSWTDITQYVMVTNGVNIGGMGRADWTSTLQAATLSLTLRNDGRFTPKLAAGAYYPNITRNTQIRVSRERPVGDRRRLLRVPVLGGGRGVAARVEPGRPQRPRRHHRERDLAAHVAAPDHPRVGVHPV